MTKFKTLQDRKVTCYVLRNSSLAVMNFSSLRMKDRETNFSKKPEIDQLLPIFCKLSSEIGEDKSQKAVNRFATHGVLRRGGSCFVFQ